MSGTWIGLLFVLVAPLAPGGNTISADYLRYPVAPKIRLMLQKALKTIESEDHQAAIRQLLGILAKYPSSAALVQSLLGIEYLKTSQYPLAVGSLEQAALLLPHDAINHYNLGVSLVLVGDSARGEQELQRALDLDHNIPDAKRLLEELTLAGR